MSDETKTLRVERAGIDYVASLLRKETVDNKTSITSSSKYTLDDLDVLGRYTSELTKWENSSGVAAYAVDEERLGLDFAMLSMKTVELENSGKLSDASSSTVQKLVDGYRESFLNRMDEELSKRRIQNKAYRDGEGYAPLDRQAIEQVYSKTMEEYQTSGDALKALIKGAEYGTIQRDKRAYMETYRSRSSQGYWDHFFKKAQQSSNQYTESETTFQKYASGWFDFQNSLKDGEKLRLNFSLKSSNSYHLPENGTVNQFA